MDEQMVRLLKKKLRGVEGSEGAFHGSVYSSFRG